MAQRFFRRGITKIFYVPVISDIDAPSATTELDVALELSCELAEISGFAFSNSPIPVPDMCDVFVKNIPGEDTAEDSSITFYELSGGIANNPIKSTLAKGVVGYILIFPYGISGASLPEAGDEAEVWPVSVSSNTREFSAGNEPARFMVEFTISDVPELEAVIAA
jgi:hypothetical protein